MENFEKREEVSKPPSEKLTFEEFLNRLDKNVWAEWVGGEVMVLSPVSYPHQRIAFFLSTLIKEKAEWRSFSLLSRSNSAPNFGEESLRSSSPPRGGEKRWLLTSRG